MIGKTHEFLCAATSTVKNFDSLRVVMAPSRIASPICLKEFPNTPLPARAGPGWVTEKRRTMPDKDFFAWLRKNEFEEHTVHQGADIVDYYYGRCYSKLRGMSADGFIFTVPLDKDLLERIDFVENRIGAELVLVRVRFASYSMLARLLAVSSFALTRSFGPVFL